MVASVANSTAETLRIATYQTELQARGPGLLLRDILKETEDVQSRLQTILAADADVVVLQGIDFDLRGETLGALNAALGAGAYPHTFALRPNAGQPTGLDMDGNGRLGEPRDGMGYGRFAGHGAMAILSRWQIARDRVQDLSDILWRDIPDPLLPVYDDGQPFPSFEVQQMHRLSSTAHWIVPLVGPQGQRISVMAFHATPPLFDGPEDQNGRRNADEIRMWQLVLDGQIGEPPQGAFVIAGIANLDPDRGDGRRASITSLLQDPRLQDPTPAQATARFENAGPLRLSYLLPAAQISVTDAGILWPAPLDDVSTGRHGLLWVDLLLAGPS
nr:endonuclease/exonuclease/phosphatase family protein [Nereida sp. MMG025]